MAEADREIDADTIVRRTIEYGLDHYPEYDRQGHFDRFKDHIAEKYARGGYIKIWIPEGENARRLEAFRTEIEKPGALEAMFNKWFDKLTK